MVIRLLILIALLVPVPVSAKNLVIGTINNEPRSRFKRYIPIANHIVKKLGDTTINRGAVVIARNLDEMASLLKRGAVDIYFDSPLVSIAVNSQAGSYMSLRRWKKGVKSYNSVVVVRRDSGITKVEDLSGRLIGFEENFSSSGYMLPRIVLERRGLMFEETSPVLLERSPGILHYLFTEDTENTIIWVIKGRIDAGAMSTKDFTRFSGMSKPDLLVLLETAHIPRQVVNFSRHMQETIVKKVSAILVRMHLTEEGRSVLKAFNSTKRFDLIPEEDVEQLSQFRPVILRLLQAD